MRAGFAKSDLTPPLGVELAGYGYYLHRCAEKVLDNLYARALILEDDSGKRAAVISCELLGLSREVCDAVLAHAADLGIEPESCIIVSVHTHTGPCIKYHEGCGYPDEAYVRELAGRICLALDGAASDLDTVTALEGVSVDADSDYIYNRAFENGPVDHFVRGFILKRAVNAPISAVSAACHGVFRGRIPAVSADFAGEINRIMESRGYASLYLNGLCGDIDPYKPSPNRLCEFACLVTDTFLANARPLPMSVKTASFDYTLKLTPVTRADITDAAREAVSRAGGADQPAAKVALIWEREMLEKFDTLSDREDIVCKMLLLGGVPVIAFPFEGFTLIGESIRAALSRCDIITLGCAEQLLGYLPTRDDIRRGAYAALESTFLYKRLPVVPGEAERLGEEAAKAVAKILA